jgi:hypothetical protein
MLLQNQGTEACDPPGLGSKKNLSKIYTKIYTSSLQSNDALCFKRMPKSKAVMNKNQARAG